MDNKDERLEKVMSAYGIYIEKVENPIQLRDFMKIFEIIESTESEDN